MAVENDIWLEFRRWKRNWEDIYSTVKTKGFSVRRVWTVTDFEGRKEAKRWAESNILPQGITLALKTANSNWGDYYLISSEKGTLEQNLFFRRPKFLFEEGSAYFVCPFIYDTFFVSENKTDYCPAFLGEQLAVEDRSSTQGKRTKPFHNDPLACGCTKLPNDSEFKSICDSTCSKCAETFGEQRTAREGQFEMALKGEIEQIYFPTQVSQGQPLLF